jgi:hypothetical protein
MRFHVSSKTPLDGFDPTAQHTIAHPISRILDLRDLTL